MKLLVIALVVFTGVIGTLCAEPVSNRVEVVAGDGREAGEKLTARLIAELNMVETNFYVNGEPYTNAYTITNRLTTGMQARRRMHTDLAWQLVEQGVTIRYVNGHYRDATVDAENGHSLSRDDKRTLAELNHVQQNIERAIERIPKEDVPRFVVDGGTRSRIMQAKYQLAVRGISISWDATNKLYFVTSVHVPDPKNPPQIPMPGL